MEVRYDGVNGAKPVAGQNEEVRLPRERSQLSAGSSRLERAYRRGSNRDNPAAGCSSFEHGVTTRLTDLDTLTVQSVCFNVFFAQRLKCARADMQGDPAVPDTGRCGFPQHCLIKVQSRSWRRNRTGVARIDGLVTIPICFARRPVQIWRQRHLPMLVKKRHQVDRKPQDEELTITPGYNRFGAAIQQQAPARLRRFARSDMSQRRALVGDPLDQYLCTTARLLGRLQAGLDHSRVVKDQ